MTEDQRAKLDRQGRAQGPGSVGSAQQRAITRAGIDNWATALRRNG